jgi:hypothetical protein
MSVPSYEGKTYVAYLDISGFKQMMTNKEKVESVLNKFYTTLYNTVYEVNSDSSPTKMNAVAVSDCAVLFLNKDEHEIVDQIEGLSKMLRFIRIVNRAFIDHAFPFMTICSIAYGMFRYENRRDSEHMRKNCMRGRAYLETFLDSRLEKPKIRPSECRLLKRGLDSGFPKEDDFRLLSSKREYYYFYWMLNDPKEERNYRRRYDETLGMLYDPLIRLLKDTADQTFDRN